MIASLGGYAFHSFATGLGGVVQGTAQASAGDVARGSFNAGQVNYRNVSAGTTSLGNFSGWTTSAFVQSVDQGNVGNITRRGNYVQVSGGSIEQGRAIAWEASAYGGSKAGLMAFEWARRALEGKGTVLNFEAARGQGVLGFTIIGEDGTAISYRPGEGGSGVLTITKNGKTLTTKVHSNGDIEGITTGKLSEGILAMFGESLVQAWAKELANIKEDSNTISKLISQADKIQDAKTFNAFMGQLNAARGQVKTEYAQQVLNRLADIINDYLNKNRQVTTGSRTSTKESQEVGTTTNVGGGVSAGIEGNVGDVSGGTVPEKDKQRPNPNIQVRSGGQAGVNLGANASNTETVASQNEYYGGIQRTVERGTQKVNTKETSKLDSKTQSELSAIEKSLERGLSYAFQHGNFKELSKALSEALQYTQRNLESYRKSLQSADSVEFRKAALPALFNQLKDEEAKRLMEQGMSKEEAYAKAAMNALNRLDDLIENKPRELFKYLNRISELPDAEGVKRDVENNVPPPGTPGNPPEDMKREIQQAKAQFEGGYYLNAMVKDKNAADKLAAQLKRYGHEANVIAITDKQGKTAGYMVSVGGLTKKQAEGLAEVLKLKNYQVMDEQSQQQLPYSYSLSTVAQNKQQADALVKQFKEAGMKANVVSLGKGKGYIVSVGGFQSESDAHALALSLGLQNYQVDKSIQMPQQQHPVKSAKR
jgi:hypothetical protein